MCLELKGWYTRKRKAKTDIVVYKHLHKNVVDGVDYYYTPYRNTPVKIGCTYDSKLERQTGFNIVNYGLHSFEFIKDCEIDGKFELNYTYKSVIVKCVIPKGSRYYKGIFISFGYKYSSLASDKLTYVEELFEIDDND